MAVSGTNGTSGTSNSAVTGTKSGIANNFDQFLTLLTTQLKNQSPLDPLDTNQFTQQLVQFAGVEQQLRTNETLGSLLSLSAVSYTHLDVYKRQHDGRARGHRDGRCRRGGPHRASAAR